MSRRGLVAGLLVEGLFLSAVLGPFSLLAHGAELTDLGKLTDYQPMAAILVTAGLIALFALYGVALLWGPSTRRASPWLALGFSALFAVTLIFLYPVTAIDVYNYAVQGHVAAFHGINPLVTPPSQVAGDPFVSYAGSWADSTSPYGPLWITITRLEAILAGANVVLAILGLKTLAAIAVVLTGALLISATADRGPRVATFAVVLYGWNPLVLLEMVGNGHNDAVMTVFLIAALVLLGKNRPVLGAISVGASVLIKFLTLGAVPLFFLAKLLDRAVSRRSRVFRLIAGSLALLGLVVVAYAPFWVGPVTLQRAQAVDTDYLSSIPALIVLLVPDALGWLSYPRLALLALVGLWQANALRLGRTSLARATFEVTFVTILIAPHFAGWYLAPLVAVAALTRDRWIQARVVAFTVAATLTTPIWAYLWWWNQDWMSLTTVHLIVVPLTFLPAVLIALLGWWAGTVRWPPAPSRVHLGTPGREIRAISLSARTAVVTGRRSEPASGVPRSG